MREKRPPESDQLHYGWKWEEVTPIEKPEEETRRSVDPLPSERPRHSLRAFGRPAIRSAEEARAASLVSLRDLVLLRSGVRTIREFEEVTTVRLDASDHQRLFPCVVHGKVTVTQDRWDCPYCPAVGESAADDHFALVRVLSVTDRKTGMLAINPS